MSCPTPKDSGEDGGISSSVPVLDSTSSSSILGGPSRHSSPSKPAFLCPSPPGSMAPNIYAKSTSPNCGISLQAEFFLSPLTTAVNYNRVARTWVTARRSEIETQRKEERGLKEGLENVFVLHGRQVTYTYADLPRHSQPLWMMKMEKWQQGWIVCIWPILSKVTLASPNQYVLQPVRSKSAANCIVYKHLIRYGGTFSTLGLGVSDMLAKAAPSEGELRRKCFALAHPLHVFSML